MNTNRKGKTGKSSSRASRDKTTKNATRVRRKEADTPAEKDKLGADLAAGWQTFLKPDHVGELVKGSETLEAAFSEIVLHSALRVLVERAAIKGYVVVCRDCSAAPTSQLCDLYQILANKQKKYITTVSKEQAAQYPPCG